MMPYENQSFSYPTLFMVKRDDYIGYTLRCTPDFVTGVTELAFLTEMEPQRLTRIVGINRITN